jgi:hypothetical protein
MQDFHKKINIGTLTISDIMLIYWSFLIGKADASNSKMG